MTCKAQHFPHFPRSQKEQILKHGPDFTLSPLRLSLICMLGCVCILYNAKGNRKVRQFSGMFGPKQRPVLLFVVCRLRPLMLPPVLFSWWSAKLSADVSPTQWKHSLMALGTSRFCSYGKRKNWRERMIFWIGLISFWAFWKCWNREENYIRPIHLSHTASHVSHLQNNFLFKWEKCKYVNKWTNTVL